MKLTNKETLIATISILSIISIRQFVELVLEKNLEDVECLETGSGSYLVSSVNLILPQHLELSGEGLDLITEVEDHVRSMVGPAIFGENVESKERSFEVYSALLTSELLSKLDNLPAVN